MSKTQSVRAASAFDDPELGGFSAGIHNLPAAAAERLIGEGKVEAHARKKKKRGDGDGDGDGEGDGAGQDAAKK